MYGELVTRSVEKMTLQTVTPATVIWNGSEGNSVTSSQSYGQSTRSVDPYKTAKEVLDIYITPAIVIIGIFVNSIIVAVMASKSFRKLPLHVYFISIAVSESFYLLVIGINRIAGYVLKTTLYRVAIACLIMETLYYIAVSYSSWLVVLVGVDRALVVTFPTKAKYLSTVKKARLAVVITLLIMVALSTFPLWMADYSKRCQYRQEFSDFNRYGKGFFTLAVHNVLPLSLLCVCYAVLVRKVLAARKKANANRRSDKLTAMALYVCVGFLIFTVPEAIFTLLGHLYQWSYLNYTARFIGTILTMISLMNYSLNFFIYMATNKQFREATRLLFRLPASSVQPVDTTSSRGDIPVQPVSSQSNIHKGATSTSSS